MPVYLFNIVLKCRETGSKMIWQILYIIVFRFSNVVPRPNENNVYLFFPVPSLFEVSNTVIFVLLALCSTRSRKIN